MTNLLNIRNEYLEAINMVDEDGVITEAGLELLEKSELSIKEKAQNIAKLVSLFDNNIEAIKKEKERLAKLEKSYKSNQEKIKTWLSYNLEKTGIEKLDTELYKFSFRKSESVEIENEEEIENEYKKVKTSFIIDKISIKNDIKAGKEVKGVKLITKNNLQIK